MERNPVTENSEKADITHAKNSPRRTNILGIVDPIAREELVGL